MIRKLLRAMAIGTSILVGFNVIAVGVASTDADAAGRPTITHKGLAAKDLPPPEETLTVRFQVENFRDIDKRARGVFVKDGRLIDVQPVRSFRDENDRPTYEFKVASPHAELSYQFYLYDEHAGVISSKRYAIRRKCLSPNLTAGAAPSNTSSGAEKMKQLLRRSAKLETELAHYDIADELLTSLKKELRE